MTVMVDQKTIFAERLKRIQTGKQFEHVDVIGHSTQKRYNKIFGKKNQKPKRTFADKMMVLIAFLCGMSSVLVGRVAYFHLAKLEGLPPAFYDLGNRGMVLFAFVLALILIVVFHLSNRSRVQALLVGCVVMHYGEAAVASNAPEFWSHLFSADYAATMAEQGRDYRLTPAG
ncbi:hypothetical protein [Defluviimonas sp. SAOS-178_SWC]|uniref:hypothetical protein n=1 Tax=Defluviimonas sp. SAOS-178_SWC TaxID=3121287 RepID=UPI00322165AF